MKINCKIVQDLLPLYHDGVCSEESRKLVEAHLAECETCKRMLAEMDGELVLPKEEANELKPLQEIKKAVKKGKRKALFIGVAIAMAVVMLLFGAVNVWWYVEHYQFHQQFAEGHNHRMHLTNSKGNVIANEYDWEDEVYRYHVSVPTYLSLYDDVYMERLENNDEGKRVSLSISRGINGGSYTYHVSIQNESGESAEWEYFMLDQDMVQEYLSHWDEETIVEQAAKLAEYRDEVMEIIEDAQEMWEFLK